MLHGIADELVARLDVALDDLLQVLEKVLSPDLKLGPDGGSRGLPMLLDVDVHYVLLEELPGQCDVLGAP